MNVKALVTLACSPDPNTSTETAWVRPVQDAVRDVRDALITVNYRGEQTLRVSTLAAWRTTLHRVLTEAATAAPDRWRYWFEPGTWLERNVRLQVVLNEITTESEEVDEVAFAQMNVPGRLGWPCWALPARPVQEVVAR